MQSCDADILESWNVRKVRDEKFDTEQNKGEHFHIQLSSSLIALSY